MLDSISFKVKFSEPIAKEIPTTPGGFSFIRQDGKEVQFDFMDSTTECLGMFRTFRMDTPDFDSFPDMMHIQSADIINMLRFEDIFIDMDECRSGIKLAKIEWFEFLFFENKNTVRIVVSPDILKDYNERKGWGGYVF